MKIKLDEGAFVPVREHSTDAGMDLKTPKGFVLESGESFVVDTGVHIQLPKNTVGLLKSKSGLNVNAGILTEGVIDEGYVGSIHVKLYNHGNAPVKFNAGDKITQLLVVPVDYATIEIVDELEAGERGNNGLGSTGR